MSRRILPRFPARVRGINALSATTTNGVLEIGIDPTNLADSANPTAPGNKTFILNTTTGDFELADVASTVVDIATQAEAEAGTDNQAVLSALRGKQSIDVNAEGGRYTPTGTGAVTRTLQAKARDQISLRDHGTLAQARTAAFSQARVLIAAPEKNSALGGAKTREGIITGHIAIGDTAIQAIDAHVGIFADELYLNTGQEMRGVSYTIRNKRTTLDEATLGWDSIPILAATVIPADNTQYIRGNMKGLVGEFIAQGGSSTSYRVKKAYPMQSLGIIGQGVVVENYYGVIINNPVDENGFSNVSEARIERAYGIYVQEMTGGFVDKAGIKFEGLGVGVAIKWNKTKIYEDTGGKLTLDFGRDYLVIANPLLNTGGSMPTVFTTKLRVIIGGSQFYIPCVAE
jgi:hypothetical protein